MIKGTSIILDSWNELLPLIRLSPCAGRLSEQALVGLDQEAFGHLQQHADLFSLRHGALVALRIRRAPRPAIRCSIRGGKRRRKNVGSLRSAIAKIKKRFS
jgi:hypothetical protein